MTAREEFVKALDACIARNIAFGHGVGTIQKIDDSRARVLAAYDAAHPAKAEATGSGCPCCGAHADDVHEWTAGSWAYCEACACEWKPSRRTQSAPPAPGAEKV